MRFFVVLYCISISIVGFICIQKGNDLTFSQSNNAPQTESFPQIKKINEAFQFPFHHPHPKKFIHFIKELNDLTGIEWVGKQLKVSLKIDKIDKNCWLWLKSEIKEFQEIVQNWINYNDQQICEYFSEKIGNPFFIKKASHFVQKGKGELVQEYLKQTVPKFLGSQSKGFKSKLKLIHGFLRIKELQHKNQEVARIIECWLTENEKPIQQWIEQKGEEPDISTSVISTVLWCCLLPYNLAPQLKSEAEKFLTLSDHQRQKSMKETIFQIFFCSSYKSFFKNCIQWISDTSDSFLNFKGELKSWIQDELSHYLEGGLKRDGFIERLKVANYFFQHFPQYFSDLIQKWLLDCALIELKDYLKVDKFLISHDHHNQLEVIRLFNQIFSKLNQGQGLIEEVIQWVENFFEKKDVRLVSYLFDPVRRLQLAVCCIRAGTPFSSIAKKWLSETETRGMLAQAMEEKEKRNFLNLLGPEELTLIYLYAFK